MNIHFIRSAAILALLSAAAAQPAVADTTDTLDVSATSRPTALSPLAMAEAAL